QKMLSQRPDNLSQAVMDAAKDLKESGRELVFEGVSGGLANVMKLCAHYARQDKRLEQRLEEGVAATEFAYTVFVKERVGAANKEDHKTEDIIEKLNVTLGLITVRIADPNLKRMVEATIALSKGTTGFLSAYLRDDQVTLDKTFGNAYSLLEGTLSM